MSRRPLRLVSTASLAFVRDALLECLKAEGIDAEVADAPSSGDPYYILLVDAPTSSADAWEEIPTDYILYDFTAPYVPSTAQISARAREIWAADVSHTGVRHVPFGSLPSLRLRAPPERTIDFVCFRPVNDRRLLKLVPLLFVYAQLDRCSCYFGNADGLAQDREQLLSHTKIAIVLHEHDDDARLRADEILPCVMNDIWVLAERSADPESDAAFADLVTWIDASDNQSLLREGLRLLHTPPEEAAQELERRRAIAEATFDYRRLLRESGALDIVRKLLASHTVRDEGPSAHDDDERPPEDPPLDPLPDRGPSSA